MKELFGGLLLAAGILIAALSGLCSLAVLFGGGSGGSGMFPIVLLIGGVPFAIGILLAVGGRSLIRRARAERNQLGRIGDTFD